MKKRLICAVMVLCVFFGLAQGALAADTEEEDVDYSRFFNKSWEEITMEFLDEIGYSENNVAIAYMNTVTGETHYYNPDLYMYAASVYKLPLNMYFGELISDGEMTMETKFLNTEYSYIQTVSLEYSSNPWSEMLTSCFGDYKNFRTAIMKYLGVTTADVDDAYYVQNSFTVRQILHCLEMLYAAPERYPDVLYHMSQAQQDNFFAMYEDRYAVAHKYGYYPFDTYTSVNDCGIIYTDDPILLVMFTSSLYGNPPALGKYCRLMCDYTQYRRGVRLEGEAAMEAARISVPADEEEPLEPDATPAVSPETTPAESPETVTAVKESSEVSVKLWIFVGILGVLLCVEAVVLIRKRRKK